MKQINAVLFEETQVQNVPTNPSSFLLGSRTAARGGKFSASGYRIKRMSFRQTAKNCKLDVWIVIFFSPENQ